MKKAFFDHKRQLVGRSRGRVLVPGLLILGMLCFTSVLFGRTSGTYSPVLPESSSCSYCSSSSSPDSSDYEPREESEIPLFEVTDRPARRLRRGVLEVAVEFPARIQRVFATTRGADQGADDKDLTSFWQLAESPDIVLSAKLNGDEVGDAFRKVSDQSARAELSASYGLKRGPNRLVLEARTQDGRFSRKKLKFVVPADVPLVAAGVDQRVAAGRPVRLEGSVSFSRNAMVHGRRKNGLVYRWRITNAPLASLRARLIDAKRAEATFHPDVPGRYELELRISGGGLKSPATDSLTVTVSPQAMVPFQTVLADDGSPEGVWVAVDRTTCGTTLDQSLSQPCWYEAGGSVEVLVLDRATLEPVSKKSYSTLSGTDLKSQIGDLDDGEDLVIIVSRPDLANPDSTLVTQLQGIGVDIASGGYLEGPFSIVGIPGSIQGKAYLNTGLTITGQHAGELSGFLKYAGTSSSDGNVVDNQFVLALSDVYAYDTRSDASTTDTNVVQIGDLTASASTSNGGLQVVTFDALNLEILTNEVYHGANDGVTGISWTDMGTRLRRALDEGNDFVIVSLLVPNGGSSTHTSGYPSEWESAGLYNMVLPAIERAGGNPDIFLRAVNENKTYSFIGSPGAGGVGYESSAVFYDGLSADDQQKLPGMAGALSGALGRGFDTRLYPTAGDPNGLQQPQLSPILYQPLSAWPMTPALGADSATGEEVALAYIAQNALGVDCNDLSESTCTEPTVSIDSTQGVRQVALDLRANYPSSWTGNSTEVNELDCDDADFSGTANTKTTSSDCDSAQVQLVGELADRSAVTNWFTALEQPFVDTQGETVTNLQQIGNIVQTCVLEQKVDAMLKAASAGWRSNLFTGTLSTLARVTEFFSDFSPEIGMVGSILGLMSDGGEFVDTASEGPSTEVESYFLLELELQQDAIEIDTQVENAVQLQITGLTLSQQAVLSDWGKMSQAATKSNMAYDEGGWEITTQGTTAMENALNYSIRQQAYRAWMQEEIDAAAQVDIYSQDLDDNATDASNWYCVKCSDTPQSKAIFHNATSTGDSEIAGFGDAQQYWPQTSILTSGETASAHYSYVMYKQAWHTPGTPTSGDDAELVPSAVIDYLFGQADSSQCPTNAGLIPPLYWSRTFDMTEVVSCPCPACTANVNYCDDEGWPTQMQWFTGFYYESDRDPVSFCTTVTSGGSPVGERCTFTSVDGTDLKPIDLAALVDDINRQRLGNGLDLQVTDDSAVMIEAYGGAGMRGEDEGGTYSCGAKGGSGGASGYAQTVSTVGTLGSSMLYLYPGEQGSERSWGGSATVVSTTELARLSHVQELSNTDPSDVTGFGILAIAGGGGGGGKGHCTSGGTFHGGDGGDGGQAIADNKTYDAVGEGTEGGSGDPGHGGGSTSKGVGGSGYPAGSNGLGGPGGILASSQEVGGGVLWHGWYWADNPRYSGNGWSWGAGGSNGNHGGAGGGGFGGGGAAKGESDNHIGGGGGGGSLAVRVQRLYGSDSPLFQGPTPPSGFEGGGGVALTFQLQ